MQDFPSNSQKAARQPAPPTPKVEPITTAKVRRPKLSSRFKDAFIGGSARDARDYVFTEVVVPAVQDTIIRAVQNGFERVIRGENAAPVRRTPSPYSTNTTSRYSYDRISAQQAAPPRTLSRQARARFNFDDIVLPSQAEANEVIERLYDLLDQAGDVRVGVLYELTNVQPSHNDYKWGWRNLRGARAVRTNGGFVLDLPEPEAF